LVGRKSESIQTPVSNLLPIEWFNIEYQPNVSHIKDKSVRKNTMMTRQRKGTVHISNLPEVIQFYKQKHRHVKAIPLTIDLPLHCPSCNEIGTPEITDDNRFEIKTKHYDLRYNHSNPKKTCYIGRVDKSNGHQYFVKLKKSITHNTLPYSGRFRTNPI
jgi:hypothetical protein